MPSNFQKNDPSIESQWRAIILFGMNSATYKFAFAKSLLGMIEEQKTRVSLSELALPYALSIVEHLKESDKQGSSKNSSFLEGCRGYMRGEVTQEKLRELTVREGFKHVVHAFHIVNGVMVPNPFYEKDYSRGRKEIVFTDNLLGVSELFQYRNLGQEVDARWKLVETAWNLDIKRSLLEVRHDSENSLFFLESDRMRRVDITSVRDSLNGYQKGKCFYTFRDISINGNDVDLCEVDHFLPHANKLIHERDGANINGVWNLVLADSKVNGHKSARIPKLRFLDRLHNRNEFYIESKHPLAETIINQTGRTQKARARFLQRQYDLAMSCSIHSWEPENELNGNF